MRKLLLLSAVVLGGVTANAQWVENFDSSTTLPDGWAIINDGDANGFVIGTPYGGAQTPNNVAKILYSETQSHDDYLVTKAITVGADSNRISFWVKSRSASWKESYSVLLSTTDQTKEAFTEELQATEIAPAEWTKQTFDLNAYDGQTVYVAVHATDVNKYELYVDSFVVDAPPSCSAPTNISSSNIAVSSVDISWTASLSTVNDGYQVYYSINDIAPDNTTVLDGTNSVTVGASATTATLNNLEEGTTYYAWVRANCNATESSSWSLKTSFSTLCLSVGVPYTMNFDNLTTTNVGACESVINYGQGNQWTVVDAPTGYTGRVLKYEWHSSNAANTWFFTQGLNLEANKNYVVKFKYGNNSTAYSEKLRVAYGTDRTATGMVNEIVNFPNIADDIPHSVEYTITPTETGAYYIGFQAYSEADQFDLYLDEIVVEESSAEVGTINQELTSLEIYPNPAKDIINISNDMMITGVEVFDINGRRLLNQNVGQASTTIDVSSFATGTYFVKVTAEGKTSTKQIIVK